MSRFTGSVNFDKKPYLEPLYNYKDKDIEVVYTSSFLTQSISSDEEHQYTLLINQDQNVDDSEEMAAKDTIISKSLLDASSRSSDSNKTFFGFFSFFSKYIYGVDNVKISPELLRFASSKTDTASEEENIFANIPVIYLSSEDKKDSSSFFPQSIIFRIFAAITARFNWDDSADPAKCFKDVPLLIPETA